MSGLAGTLVTAIQFFKKFLMKVVDDPMGRMDKVMDEMLKTKTRFQHYRPQLCPHFIHNVLIIFTIIIFFIFFLLYSARVRCTLADYLIGFMTD